MENLDKIKEETEKLQKQNISILSLNDLENLVNNLSEILDQSDMNLENKMIQTNEE